MQFWDKCTGSTCKENDQIHFNESRHWEQWIQVCSHSIWDWITWLCDKGKQSKHNACVCWEQCQVKCSEVCEAVVQDISIVFILNIPCLHSTQLEEPTIPITLTCFCKSKLCCGLHWCHHQLKSLFCAIVCFLFSALYFFNTNVKSLGPSSFRFVFWSRLSNVVLFLWEALPWDHFFRLNRL